MKSMNTIITETKMMLMMMMREREGKKTQTLCEKGLGFVCARET